MNLPPHSLSGLSRFERWFLGIAWLLIVAKCFVVWWAIPRYHVPIQPLWIIGPTLFAAAFVTMLWTAHSE